MVARWTVGRVEIDSLIATGHLQRVPHNPELARAYLEQARAHVTLADQGVGSDAVGAFQLAYDAARKALASLLVVQGPRPTSRGGHIVIRDALRAQFSPRIEPHVKEFDVMRRMRNDNEYPTAEHPVASRDDATHAIQAALGMIDAAERLMDQLPPY